MRFRNNTRKEQNMTEAKEHRLDLLKKVYRLPFDAKITGDRGVLSKSVIRCTSQKNMNLKM